MAKMRGMDFPLLRWWIVASVGERLAAVAMAVCVFGLGVGIAVFPRLDCDRQQAAIDRANTEVRRASYADRPTQCAAYRKYTEILDKMPPGWRPCHSTHPYDDRLGWVITERNYYGALMDKACK